MIVCGLLLVAGVSAAVRWGNLAVLVPEDQEERTGRLPVSDVLRRYLWWLTVTVVAGVGSGVLVAGAGGRLIMRLLALTSPDARGLITEAGETVGRISTGGTIALFVFGGVFAGLLSALIFMLIHRWLPSGRLGGLSLGLLLLLLLSTRLEPLRPDNIDFTLVGPPALAVITFGLLALVQGMAVAAIAGRYGRSLPLIARRPRTLLRYAPVLLLLLFPPAAAVAVVAGAVVVLVSRLPDLPAGLSSRLLLTARIALSLLALAALPSFVIAVTEIL